MVLIIKLHLSIPKCHICLGGSLWKSKSLVIFLKVWQNKEDACLIPKLAWSTQVNFFATRPYTSLDVIQRHIWIIFFLLLSHYPKPVSEEIANAFDWKTTYCSLLKQLLDPLSSPIHLYGGNFLPPQLTAIAPFFNIYLTEVAHTNSMHQSIADSKPQVIAMLWRHLPFQPPRMLNC